MSDPHPPQPRSKRMYVYWGIALALLVLVVIVSWVAVPIIQVHMAVRDVVCAEKDATFVPRLGGARAARRKLKRCLYLPDWMAPDKSQAAYLLRNCPEGEKALVEILHDPAAPLEVRLLVPATLTAEQAGEMDVREDRSWLVREFGAALRDPNDRVRVAAAEGIWWLASDQQQSADEDAALDFILKALKHRDPAVRLDAAESLHRIEEMHYRTTIWGPSMDELRRRVEPALEAAMKDPDPAVRDSATSTFNGLLKKAPRRFRGTPAGVPGEKK